MHVLAAIPLLAALLLADGCCTTARRAPSATHLGVRLDSATVGRTPPGFTTALTGGGAAVAWVVRDDASATGGRAIVQESTDDTSYRFPLCIYDGFLSADVSTQVRFKAISGNVDQAAGLVLRYTPETYYVARANALEDNVNLFKTVNGQRLKITEVPAKVTPGQWHTLGFAAKGPHLTVTYDGAVVIQTDDATITTAGRIGLWTKADSVTAFADLRIESK